LDDAKTRHCTEAERALLAGREGGCQVPIGAIAEIGGEGEGAILRLRAAICSLDGRSVVRGELSGHPAAATRVGQELAEGLKKAGGDKILASLGRAR
jgi:hydroxymethylbilane synthase